MDWFRNKKDTKQPQEPAAPVISQPDIQTEDDAAATDKKAAKK